MKFFTVDQTIAELAKLGIPASRHTVRHWCRKSGFGIQFVADGTWYVPESKINALHEAAAGAAPVASTVAESDRRKADVRGAQA
jgi:hypothetical protein